MKYPEYGTWYKQIVIETIRKQKIHSSKNTWKSFFSIQTVIYIQLVYMTMKYVKFYGL